MSLQDGHGNVGRLSGGIARLADTLSQQKAACTMSALRFHNREHLALGNHVVNADED
jgi:hypothetical protein